ncbi:hypothetical protein [Dehalobacterium formicoaceticum]|uniref:Uncharacterized protein n=1 Tax=Dehalobacterium formicoaceticum TaxID=51515 RepID=A0ABT1Y272_9FIRM|nr:hypothetical protein [Dehalobacterium formicoaceticum]MCR6544968.1 hypothetical protein [Dehalobacterium formicoaceticum]
MTWAEAVVQGVAAAADPLAATEAAAVAAVHRVGADGAAVPDPQGVVFLAAAFPVGAYLAAVEKAAVPFRACPETVYQVLSVGAVFPAVQPGAEMAVCPVA